MNGSSHACRSTGVHHERLADARSSDAIARVHPSRMNCKLMGGMLLLIAATAGAKTDALAAADVQGTPPQVQCQIGRSMATDGKSKSTAFPLHVRPRVRYLEDAVGEPFFMQGDAAWSLIAQLKKNDVEAYLQDRRRRGFNTLVFSLLEHRFTDNAPNNAYGEAPFLTPGDYGTPNEKYFAYADWVLTRAQEMGFVVLLTPSYTGFRGGEEGWYQEMLRNGPDKLHAYGRYLGQRFKKFRNIIWLHAGDYNPPNKDLVRAIADGIREVDHTSLHSAHGSTETAALDYWRGESWLQINSVYTYRSVVSASLKQYEAPEVMPFILVESLYEGEHNITELHVRSQAYQAVLSGATGQIFGNNPIWHFDGPGLFSAPTSWRQALGSRGSQSMTHLCTLLEPTKWWLLEPDIDQTFLLNEHSFLERLGFKRDERPIAALARDHSLGMVYMPSRRSITLDLSRLAGPMVDARWYDPASGTFKPVKGAPFHRQKVVIPAATKPNGAGYDDWVLVLKSQPTQMASP